MIVHFNDIQLFGKSEELVLMEKIIAGCRNH